MYQNVAFFCKILHRDVAERFSLPLLGIAVGLSQDNGG